LKASIDQFGNQAMFSLEIHDEPIVVMNPKGRSNDQITPKTTKMVQRIISGKKRKAKEIFY